MSRTKKVRKSYVKNGGKKRRVNTRKGKKGGTRSYKIKVNIHKPFNSLEEAQHNLTYQYRTYMSNGNKLSKNQEKIYDWLNKFIERDFKDNKDLTKEEYRMRIRDIMENNKRMIIDGILGSSVKMSNEGVDKWIKKGWMPYFSNNTE
jgi:hypothetical protein